MTQYNKRPWNFGNLVPENFIDKLQANIIHRANKNLPKKKKVRKEPEGYKNTLTISQM